MYINYEYTQTDKIDAVERRFMKRLYNFRGKIKKKKRNKYNARWPVKYRATIKCEMNLMRKRLMFFFRRMLFVSDNWLFLQASFIEEKMWSLDASIILNINYFF